MNKLFKISFLIMGVSFFSGCGADKSGEEVVNLNEEAVEVSTTDKKGGDSLLKAPGNYLRNKVGQIDKAKKATAVYEKAASEHMDIPAEDGQ